MHVRISLLNLCAPWWRGSRSLAGGNNLPSHRLPPRVRGRSIPASRRPCAKPRPFGIGPSLCFVGRGPIAVTYAPGAVLCGGVASRFLIGLNNSLCGGKCNYFFNFPEKSDFQGMALRGPPKRPFSGPCIMPWRGMAFRQALWRASGGRQKWPCVCH